MRLLILTQQYPSEAEPYSAAFVHTRNLEYVARGAEVTTISFSARASYRYQGIDVLGTDSLGGAIPGTDAIVAHAPNLRNHIRLLSRIQSAAIIFVFHGHEVLSIHRDYPPPYKWNRPSTRAGMIRRLYDRVKLAVLPRTLRRMEKRNRVGYIFVSDWMRDRARTNLGLPFVEEPPSVVIPNVAHSAFLRTEFDPEAPKDADFVTIRPLDESKYAVDLVIACAAANPARTFDLFGRGTLFDHVDRPPNLTWHNRFIPQNEIPTLLNRYRAALMPTRLDAQGVMACEIASFGMPLVTSDIEICRQVFSPFSNVALLTDNEIRSEIGVLPDSGSLRDNPFDARTVIPAELEFFQRVIESQ